MLTPDRGRGYYRYYTRINFIQILAKFCTLLPLGRLCVNVFWYVLFVEILFVSHYIKFTCNYLRLVNYHVRLYFLSFTYQNF
ncbi:hypothetical protein GLOIN_2v1590174 [Rhizophagus irregularis DAOM 181602=DAOM 197198]|uniref:Uncharacterized protein n=1 Tax=Rhizophagus irregularis (strain DAOM 181602 / DAOM 197198 / MUCL 43194) TaxID=747089 RepID=A0A2P4Q5Z8_RHIID|nr:hypothetical protein GLOIN_2v1590174 [Rhizophagus irregularis DAOM 181602=DAOM 197198]POG73044.1 hypothetical protein GLOIN_2v1590174 [Rhizophagus irregularis DAOM 181602=DAOM 197198]GET50664.1 hypothetical protein GLOIN_2v1590174 [Rhizophagus irregularis DAOM 181602=DAOM 197198]|eukprot:XP_025179910.1 hypothetical protein GLOIN_2v1590174 [Rhizophagus irregularis DAOM 181602=DAOM 197198]